MTNTTTNAATTPRPMRFGRAMHMDLARASDEDLSRAYKVLDDYDTAGKASAYTQEAIDYRLNEIDDEGDRRAGVEPVYVPRTPGLREAHEARVLAESAERIGEDGDEAVSGRNPAQDADVASEDIGDDDLDPTSAQFVPTQETLGLVPGERSAI